MGNHPVCFPVFCRVCQLCRTYLLWMVALLHIETFVTFDFEPSLISRVITESDLDQIKGNLGYWATELYKMK